MEVHRVFGPGFLESVYEEALAHEFDLQGIPYERQAQLNVRYKDIIAGKFRADFPSTTDLRSPLRTCLIDEKVVVELKAKALTDGDDAQLYNYPSTNDLVVAQDRR